MLAVDFVARMAHARDRNRQLTADSSGEVAARALAGRPGVQLSCISCRFRPGEPCGDAARRGAAQACVADGAHLSGFACGSPDRLQLCKGPTEVLTWEAVESNPTLMANPYIPRLYKHFPKVRPHN